jgi:hypothetical protein
MASIKYEGLDEVMASMKSHGELVGKVADKMLMAGAEEVKKAWAASARKHDHKDTGDMIKSIDYSRSPKTAKDIRTIDIYPQGKDRKGIRNAEKAFILHYGTSSIKGSHWVDDAEAMAEEDVIRVYEQIWDEHLKGI